MQGPFEPDSKTSALEVIQKALTSWLFSCSFFPSIHFKNFNCLLYPPRCEVSDPQGIVSAQQYPIPLPVPGIKTRDDKIHPAVTTMSLLCGNHIFFYLCSCWTEISQHMEIQHVVLGVMCSFIQLVRMVPYDLNQLESPFLGI